MARKSEKKSRRTDRAIERIVEQIAAIDVVCAGTILERRKVCGRANCRCAHDPQAMHGPYYEWTRRENGRFVHTVVPADQARQITRAIKNYKVILKLLQRWRSETCRLLGIRNGRKRLR